MPKDTIRLLLGEAEVEVLEDALDLYLRARPRSVDSRFDYRYRIAQGILTTLSGEGRLGPVGPAGDDAMPEREQRATARRDD